MLLLTALILAVCFAVFAAKPIKKHARLFYIGTVVLDIALVTVTYTGANAYFPPLLRDFVFPLFSNCAIATALFIVVMMTGALPNGSAAIARLMPIRAELSIIASLLTLGHNLAYGKTYFVLLFTSPDRLSGSLLAAALCSLVMLAIMLPLMITSFPRVRRRMKPKRWKKLQRLAYIFYALIYVHVLLLDSALLAAGQKKYLFNIFVYTVVFAIYAGMRIKKALSKRHSAVARTVPALTVIVFLALAGLCIPKTSDTVVIAETAETTSTDVNKSGAIYADGAYEGHGVGFRGDITVNVTVADGTIEDIAVTSSQDDEPYLANALAVIDRVLAAQTDDVDTVSGATFSSRGIREAVSDALSAARGEQPPVETEPVVTEPVVTEPVETEPVVTEPVETEPVETEPVVTEPVETEPVEPEPVVTEPVVTEPVEPEPVVTEPVETEPVVTEPVETEPVVTEPIEPEPVVTEPIVTGYKDGAYFGNGEGFNGNIQVAVMISNGDIASVIVMSKSDDADFFDSAVAVIDNVIATQSTDVDTVSGATFSSRGILAAIDDALAQAKG